MQEFNILKIQIKSISVYMHFQQLLAYTPINLWYIISTGHMPNWMSLLFLRASFIIHK